MDIVHQLQFYRLKLTCPLHSRRIKLPKTIFKHPFLNTISVCKNTKTLGDSWDRLLGQSPLGASSWNAFKPKTRQTHLKNIQPTLKNTVTFQKSMPYMITLQIMTFYDIKRITQQQHKIADYFIC